MKKEKFEETKKFYNLTSNNIS